MFKIKTFEPGWSESEWNPANFEEAITQYQPQIYKFIYGLVRERQLAQDLTQDTFLRAYIALCKETSNPVSAECGNLMETTPPFIAWLYTIARNAAISELRRRKIIKFTSFTHSDADGQEYEVTAFCNTHTVEPGSELENQYALRDELEQAINRVGKVHLTALFLHLDGYSYEEVSKLTRTSLSSVKTQIFRAKQNLRRSFLSQPTSPGPGPAQQLRA